MKKSFLSLLLVVALSLNLFGCAKTEVKSVADSTVENNANVTISIEIADNIKKLYLEKVMDFANIKNPRDLGGYKNKDGKIVKSKLLLRGGHLAKITDEEKAKLINEYNLKEIIDFRTNAEIGRSVDKDIEGVGHTKIQIINEIDGDNPVITNMKEITGDNNIDMMASYYRYEGGIDKMYDGIVNSEIAHKGYRKFFDILLNNDGATFFHCSSGKDRTGFAAVFILSILGIDRKTILDDYEASNVYFEKSRENALTNVERLKAGGFTDADVVEIIKLTGIDRGAMEKALDMIDKKYGGMDAYLHNQIGLTDDEMDKLREKYLENESQNDFYDVLDTLKNVQPGTAGSSLKIVSASYKLINACKSRLPLDRIASEWVSKQDTQDFSNINEAFTSVYDSIDQFRDSENIKGMLDDVGIDLPDDIDFGILVDEAKKVLKVVIDATK